MPNQPASLSVFTFPLKSLRSLLFQWIPKIVLGMITYNAVFRVTLRWMVDLISCRRYCILSESTSSLWLLPWLIWLECCYH